MMDFRRCGIFGSLYACARTCYLSASSLPSNVVLANVIVIVIVTVIVMVLVME